MAPQTEFGFETTASEVAAAFPESVKGKTVVITGVSSDGIGSATAAALATQSPTCLILTGRTASKVEEVIDNLKTTYPSINYKFLELDLSSMASVRSAASTVHSWADVLSIDILINNAGIMAIPTLTHSIDGLEMHFATNHIGHFLFTNMILPKVITSAHSNPNSSIRIVNLSSYGHVFSPIRFSDPSLAKLTSELPLSERPTDKVGMMGIDPANLSYNPYIAYAQSKTANVLFSVSLNAKLTAKYPNFRSYAVHPGSIDTGLQRHVDRETILEGREKAREAGVKINLKTKEQGAGTTCVAALSTEIEAPDLSGEVAKGIYLVDSVIDESQCMEYARDMEAAERLWGLSEELVGEKFDL